MENDKQMSVSVSDDGVFAFTSAAGGTAVIDTAADTLYSEDFENFINTTMKRQDGADSVYYDGSPFLRIAEVTYDKGPDPVSIDFSKYDIDIHADKNDIWLPLLTASDLFSGIVMLQCFYDGSELLFIDSCSGYNPAALLTTPEYYEKIASAFFRDGKRNPVLAKFCYDELCFMYDTFYGYPGSIEIEEKLLEKGLDQTLRTHDKFTAQAREWIKSVDPAEVYAGALILIDYLGRDLHSIPYSISLPGYYSIDDPATKASDLLESVGYERKPSLMAARKSKTELLHKLRTDAWGDDMLVISGDTAVFLFDSFDYDYDSWKKYSKEGGDIPDDLITAVKKALDEAKADPKVKNFVFDISINEGGSGDVGFLIEAFMTGSSYMQHENILTDQRIITRYDADTSFDGVFDEKRHDPLRSQFRNTYKRNFLLLQQSAYFDRP